MSRRQRQQATNPTQQATISDSLRASVKACISEYTAIPEPAEEWHFSEANISKSAHHKLIADGGVHQTGRNGERSLWRTDPDVYAEIQRIIDEFPILECGHKAFRTMDLDSERPYSCVHDPCDARYTRAEIEAVLR